MNLWKPLALVSMAALFVTIGYQSAHASAAPAPPPANVAGAQPHLPAALASLETAKSALQKAEPDKGGWRAAALVSTEVAIKEVKRGIQFDNTH